MRSTVKILLGLKYLICIIVILGGITIALSCFINPGAYLKPMQNINASATNGDVFILGYILLIAAAYSIFAIIAANYALKVLDKAMKKRELTIAIILLYCSLSIVSASLILFSPKTKILSTHPYFE